MMRVTNSMMTNNLLRDLHRNNRLMEQSNRRLSSGKEFRLPGENPIGTSKSMLLNTGLNKNNKFIDNMYEGVAWLEYTDDALGDSTSILLRARELTIYGANDIHDETSRLAVAEEIDALKDTLFEISNSDYAGRYIFAGEKTDTKPYNPDGSFNGNDNFFAMEIGPGNYIEVNLPGSIVFGNNQGPLPYNKDSTIGTLELISRDLRGQAEVKDLKVVGNAGLTKLDAQDLQEGNYQIYIDTLLPTTAKDSWIGEQQSFLRALELPTSFFEDSIGVTSTFLGNDPENDASYSGSMEIEVLKVHTKTDMITANFNGHFYDIEGNHYHVYQEIELDMGALANGAVFTIDRENLNGLEDLTVYATDDLQGVHGGLKYQRGDKVTLSFTAALKEDMEYEKVELAFQAKEESTVTVNHTAYFKRGALQEMTIGKEDFQLQFFTLREGHGFSYDGKIDLSFEDVKPGEISFTSKKVRVGDRIAYLDDIIETILIQRASLGGKVHRIELNKSYLKNHDLRLNTLLSENEDADIASTILDLKIQETVYRSALASGARMIQPSLIDFLR